MTDLRSTRETQVVAAEQAPDLRSTRETQVVVADQAPELRSTRETQVVVADSQAATEVHSTRETFVLVADSQGAVQLSTLKTFLPDTTATKMGNAMFELQPILGDNEVATLKQWIDATHAFDAIGADTTMTPLYNGNVTATTGTAKVPSQFPDSKLTLPVPRNAALGTSLRFKLTAQSGAPWKWKGCSVRFEPVSEESKR